MSIFKISYKVIINLFNAKYKQLYVYDCLCAYFSSLIKLVKNSDGIFMCFVAVF